MLIEIFKTNVNNQNEADKLILEIHKTLKDSKANFDLEDCDKILRIEAKYDKILPNKVIDILECFGFEADILAP